jgi:UDP-N-acetylglucosamine:LPS N-acetylglucosamine transferase
VFLQAENQYELANALQRAGAAALVTSASNLQNQFAALLDAFLSAPQKLNEMSKASAAIVDGMGTRSVIAHLELQK